MEDTHVGYLEGCIKERDEKIERLEDRIRAMEFYNKLRDRNRILIYIALVALIASQFMR